MKSIVKFLKLIQQFFKGKKVYILALIRFLYGLLEFSEGMEFETLLDSAFQASLLSAVRAAISKSKSTK